MFQVNLSKAKEFKKQALRLERQSLMDGLDVKFMRALETDDSFSKQLVIRKKNALRDITDAVDRATTIDEINSISCQKALDSVG